MFFSRAMFLPAWRESIKTTLVADLSKALASFLARGKRLAVEMFAEATMAPDVAVLNGIADLSVRRGHAYAYACRLRVRVYA